MKHDYDFEEFRDYGLFLMMTIMQKTSAERGKTTKKNAVLAFFVLAESTQVKWLAKQNEVKTPVKVANLTNKTGGQKSNLPRRRF